MNRPVANGNETSGLKRKDFCHKFTPNGELENTDENATSSSISDNNSNSRPKHVTGLLFQNLLYENDSCHGQKIVHHSFT